MTYTITLPNGQTLGTILDGTADTTHTSLTLVGRNYSNYGQIMTNNLVDLLVNWSANTAPMNPNSGQLWWDAGNTILKVYTGIPGTGANGTEWKPVGGATAQATSPSSTTAGDLWWDTNNEQLYVYSTNEPGWILVGPTYPAGHKTTAITEQIADNIGGTHYVLSIFVDGNRTGIISNSSQFTPATTISGFATINPGYNMTSAANYAFWGTANNASYLGAIPAANYWNSVANNYGTGSLTIASNVGIVIGTQNNFIANVHDTTGTAQLWNFNTGANISLHVTTPTGSVKALAAYGADGRIYLSGDPTAALGAATKQYVDNSFVNANLQGVSTSVTPPAMDNSTRIATTAFVTSGISGLYSYKITSGNTWAWVSSNSANLVVNSTTVMTASQAGVGLTSGATAVTQGDTYNGSGNSAVATTQFVKTATQWWGGSAKFVSNAAPVAGVNDGGSNNGDFWFQIAN